MQRGRLTGWPLALLAAIGYTAGMALLWLFADHSYAETALLLRDVLLGLALLVLLTLALAWWSGITVHRSREFGWFGLGALVVVGLAMLSLALSLSSGVSDRGLILVVLVGTALVGIGEETAFRGIALNALAQRMSLPWAVVASSVLFGLLHSVNVMLQPAGATVQQVVLTSIVGLFLGWTYVLSGGNLALVVVVHWLWDFALIAGAETVLHVIWPINIATLLQLALAVAGTVYGFAKLRGMSWADWDAVRGRGPAEDSAPATAAQS